MKEQINKAIQSLYNETSSGTPSEESFCSVSLNHLKKLQMVNKIVSESSVYMPTPWLNIFIFYIKFVPKRQL